MACCTRRSHIRPCWAGKLKSVDDSATLKVIGVKKTIAIDPFKPPHAFQPLGGVAVIADNTFAAFKGRKKSEDRLGQRQQRELQFGRLQEENCRKPRASRAKSCIPLAIPTLNSPRAGRLSKLNISLRTWHTHRWNLRWR